MERFTEKFKDGRNIIRKGITDVFHAGVGRFFDGEAIDKLAEYEDIGTVDDFKEAIQNVKTLSSMWEKLNDKEVAEYHELMSYKDLEEQGKLIKLPCKFGDTVYVKMPSGGYAAAEVRDYIYFYSCGFCVVVTSDKFDKKNIPFSEFGKTIFLTPEETEMAMKNTKERDLNERDFV